MKALLEPVLKFLPTYLPGFYQLIVRPKTSVVGWVDEDHGDLTRPLAFVACTVAIGFLLQLPILGKQDDFSKLVAALSVLKIIAMVSVAAVIHLSFRLFRGRANFPATLSAYLYLVSPLYLFAIILAIIAHGLVRSHSPAMAAVERLNPGLLRNTPDLWKAFQAEAPGLASTYDAVSWLSVLLLAAWLVAGWGVFRRLHDRGRLVSIAAATLSLVGGGTLTWGLLLLAYGMFGTASPILR